MPTSVASLLLKTALVLCLVEAGLCRFLQSSEESFQNPSLSGIRVLRSRPVLYSDALTGIDPSAFVVRQNADERRSRLYIGKRPRVEPQQQPLQHDGLSEDVDLGPWPNMMREVGNAERQHHGIKDSSVYSVRRRSIPDAVDGVSGEHH